jgi:hypothetical protein
VYRLGYQQFQPEIVEVCDDGEGVYDAHGVIGNGTDTKGRTSGQ